MTDEEIIEDALGRYPECSFGQVVNGMNCWFQLTRVAKLWRNEECCLAGDPCKHEVEGYPGYGVCK